MRPTEAEMAIAGVLWEEGPTTVCQIVAAAAYNGSAAHVRQALRSEVQIREQSERYRPIVGEL